MNRTLIWEAARTQRATKALLVAMKAVMMPLTRKVTTLKEQQTKVKVVIELGEVDRAVHQLLRQRTSQRI